MYLRTVCFLIFLLLPGVLPAAVTPEEFFAKAAGQMAETSSLQADFIQTKRLKAFRKSLVITGNLCMDRSGRFAWHVRTPIRYSCVIADGNLLQWDADTGKRVRIRVSSHPGLQYLTKSLTGYFSGDFTGMQKEFTAYSCSERNSCGNMRPKEGTPASNFIKDICFTFSDPTLSVLKNVKILELSGDETTVEFLHPVRNQPIPPFQWDPEQK